MYIKFLFFSESEKIAIDKALNNHVAMVTVTTPTSIKFSPSCLRLTVSSSILLYHWSSLEHDNTSSPACILDRLGADSLYDCNDSCNEAKSLELEHSCTCNNNNNNNNNTKRKIEFDWTIDQIMNCNFKQSNTSATHVCVCISNIPCITVLLV